MSRKTKRRVRTTEKTGKGVKAHIALSFMIGLGCLIVLVVGDDNAPKPVLLGICMLSGVWWIGAKVAQWWFYG